MSGARALVAGLLIAATVAILLWRGLDATSGLIELGTFVVALVAWVLAGERERRGPAGPLVRDVVARRGDVDVDQSGPDPRVERVDAGRHARVRQRARDA